MPAAITRPARTRPPPRRRRAAAASLAQPVPASAAARSSTQAAVMLAAAAGRRSARAPQVRGVPCTPLNAPGLATDASCPLPARPAARLYMQLFPTTPRPYKPNHSPAARQSYRQSALRPSASSRGSRTRDAVDGSAPIKVRAPAAQTGTPAVCSPARLASCCLADGRVFILPIESLDCTAPELLLRGPRGLAPANEAAPPTKHPSRRPLDVATSAPPAPLHTRKNQT
jgi:hypothetical protein